MDTPSTLMLLIFGFGLGLKHAIEADHLAAVSTIVTQRKTALSAAFVGGLWGVGHTISLFVAGIAVIFFHLEISERAGQTLEFCVALMLIVLGIDALRRVITGQTHSHEHKHGDHVHAHPHTHEPDTVHSHSDAPPHTHDQPRVGFRPLVIGMIHGLAGSGALMLLVLATISSPIVGLTYIAVFGIGSIGGMMLMSLLLGLPMQFAANRFQQIEFTLRALAGLFSLGFGIFMVYEIGFVDGLFNF